jgi:hypothetical protein
MSLAKIGQYCGKNEPTSCSTVLNSASWACMVFPHWWAPWNHIPMDTKDLLYISFWLMSIYLSHSLLKCATHSCVFGPPTPPHSVIRWI